MNGFTGLAEISDTQSAACLLGMKSYMSTESHWLMFVKGAAAFQHEMQLRREAVHDPQAAWEDDSDFEARSDSSAESSDGDILEGRDEYIEQDIQAEQFAGDGSRGRGRFGRAQIFNVNGRPIPVPQHIHYRFRGNALARLNFYEWCAILCLKERCPDDEEQREVAQQGGRRRTGNSTFEIAHGYPLRSTHPETEG